MIKAVLQSRNGADIGSFPIRSHNVVMVRRKLRELIREYPDADWLELYHHNGERLISCQIGRIFERIELILLR